MKPKSLVWIVLALICIVPALAAQPFQSSSAGTLSIVYPKIDAFIKGVNVSLHFHVYNSTGSRMENESAICIFHLYNASNDVHLLQTSLTPETFEYTILLNESITKNQGVYPYLVDCKANATNTQSGFLSNSFQITDDGFPKQDTPAGFLWALILIPVLLGAFFLIGAATLGDDHSVFKLFLFVLSFPMFFVSLNFGLVNLIRFYDFVAMERLIGTTTWWLGIIFGVILVYFIVYAFIKIIETINMKKQEKREY